MFNFTLIVVKKLLKSLATYVGSVNFLSFTCKVGTFPLNVLSLSVCITFHVVLFLLAFAISLT